MLVCKLVGLCRSLSRSVHCTAIASCSQATASSASANSKPIAAEADVDELYTRIDIKLQGHDPAVLQSYETFVSMVCKELQLPLTVEDRNRPHFKRLTLNRSPFVHKRHMVQYEFRTFHKTLKLARLTGSTASVFLEYIQRNLPEGVAMHVMKERAEPLTEFLHKLNGDL